MSQHLITLPDNLAWEIHALYAQIELHTVDDEKRARAVDMQTLISEPAVDLNQLYCKITDERNDTLNNKELTFLQADYESVLFALDDLKM